MAVTLTGVYVTSGHDTEIRLTVEALVDAAIKETGAASKKEMGKVIGALKLRPEAGIIDFGAASKLVQAKLP